jgi:hypothetical protein
MGGHFGEMRGSRAYQRVGGEVQRIRSHRAANAAFIALDAVAGVQPLSDDHCQLFRARTTWTEMLGPSGSVQGPVPLCLGIAASAFFNR